MLGKKGVVTSLKGVYLASRAGLFKSRVMLTQD